MLKSIIGFSIRNKLIIGMFTLALVAFGAYNVTKLPIDAVPDITNNQVMVITTSPSLGAADIERLITFPIEQNTRNIPGIIEQRSFSRFGLSLVTIVFDDNTDIYWARQQVSERLVQVQEQIPAGLGVPSMGPVTTGLGEIFQYVIRPEPGYESKYDAMELRTIQDWVVRRQLLGTEGIADVSSFGGKLKQYEIAVNTDKLQAHNLTISDVLTALEKNNQNTGGAYIEKGPMVLYIRTEGLVKTNDEIGVIPVAQTDKGVPVLIRDIGTVQQGYSTRYGAMCYNGDGEVAGGIVMMLKGANSSDVIENVKSKIASIQETLPKGVKIEAFLDRTKMVNNALDTVTTNLMEGALIVVFVLVLFLGNFRAGLLVASVIPLAMLFAIIMMNLFGVGGNLMSLGALDFGLIVDGTVIIVEAILHRLHHNKLFHNVNSIDQQTMNEEVEFSSGKIMKSAAFGQVIILIVYLPFFALQGIEGKMFQPMAMTVSFAIIGAFLLSLTYVPMMSSLFLSKKISHKKTFADKMMEAVQRVYQPALERVLKFPKTIVAISIGLFIISVFILSRMGGEFIPELEEGDFAVETRVLTGSSLTTTIKATQQTAAILVDQFPEVEKVVTKIGSGEIPTDPMPMEASDMMVVLKPKKEWTSAKSFDELAEKMSEAVSVIPGVTVGFQFPVQMRFNELMTGARQDVVCKIFGENLDSLAYYAEKVGAVVSTVDGAKDLYVEPVTGMPQIVVDYKRDAIAQYGLSVEEVNRVVESAFAGAVCGQVFEDERRFDMVVRLESESRTRIEDVQNLLISTPAGTQVPLRQLADVGIKVGPNQIQREEAQRRITVGFNVRGRDVQSLVKELEGKIKSQVKLPSGYYITYGGQFENLTAAKKRLGLAVPVALVLIFLLLYFAFKSVRQGLLIYSAIPLAAIGGIFTLWIIGMPFSISAGVGFIALFGVAVLNGIVLITEFNSLEANGMKDQYQRIITGTRILLRPVLMTAAVASLGFLPMALSNGAGAEVQRPLASVVIGGLITATILTLFVLPVLYNMFNHNTEAPKKGGGLARLREQLKKMKKKKAHTKPGTALLFLLFFSTPLWSQQPVISLEAAIDSAMKQNQEVLIAAMNVNAATAAQKTAWQIPATEIGFESGQINSYAKDNRFTVAQSFDFPTVYGQRSKMLKAETGAAVQNELLMRLEVRRQITSLYYKLLVLNEQRKVLKRYDSLCTIQVQRQTLSFNAGASNILEKTSAETKQSSVANEIVQLEAEFLSTQIALSQLMHTQTLYQPDARSSRITAPLDADTTGAVSHPQARMAALNREMAMRDMRIARQSFLPRFTLGYYNMSITGWQIVDNADVYFNNSYRFSSFAVGVSVPLFFNSNAAQVRYKRFGYQAAEMNYSATVWNKQNEIKRLNAGLAQSASSLQYFEKSGLPNADVIETAAQQRLQQGEISYFEWMVLMEQSIGIRRDYLNAIDKWNNDVIGLRFASAKL